MNSLKIGTHNSATGEKSSGFLSRLGKIFAKCQRKTLSEQLNSGITWFDLRVKEKEDTWVFAHGLWRSKMTVKEAMNLFKGHECILNFTYEGDWHSYPEDFINLVAGWIPEGCKVGFIAIKKPKWNFITTSNITSHNYFPEIDKKHFWYCLLPIPWIWNKLLYRRPIYNSVSYIIVDFF